MLLLILISLVFLSTCGKEVIYGSNMQICQCHTFQGTSTTVFEIKNIRSVFKCFSRCQKDKDCDVFVYNETSSLCKTSKELLVFGGTDIQWIKCPCVKQNYSIIVTDPVTTSTTSASTSLRTETGTTDSKATISASLPTETGTTESKTAIHTETGTTESKATISASLPTETGRTDSKATTSTSLDTQITTDSNTATSNSLGTQITTESNATTSTSLGTQETTTESKAARLKRKRHERLEKIAEERMKKLEAEKKKKEEQKKKKAEERKRKAEERKKKEELRKEKMRKKFEALKRKREKEEKLKRENPALYRKQQKEKADRMKKLRKKQALAGGWKSGNTRYLVKIYTSSEMFAGTGSWVTISLNNAKFETLKIKCWPTKGDGFEMGSIESFHKDVTRSLGRIVRIRMTMEMNDYAPSWLLQKFYVQERVWTGSQFRVTPYRVVHNRWIPNDNGNDMYRTGTEKLEFRFDIGKVYYE